MSKQSSIVYAILFGLSGFAGLIYESVWSHYVKLFLGHSAYAQTLVMAIYMGGMALGAWLCSVYSVRWKNLILGYALVEAVIGVFALLFHPVFDQVVEFSFENVIPHLHGPASIIAYQWVLSALLILPQAILIGMPFPLISAGIVRMHPSSAGQNIALLYFFNTIGGALGVLASGFLLIHYFGMPGAIRTAGSINILLALVVWYLTREQNLAPVMPTVSSEPLQGTATYKWFRFQLFLALATGAASFIYEIGWIRMLSLVLGSSTRAFELMLSAFLIGLAFGSLWLQRRIHRITSPLRYLAAVQVLMGLFALATLPVYEKSFDVMVWLMNHLSKTDGGYALFNISSHLIALAVMLPATFCAGMTLPLITFSLIDRQQGEKSIGVVYAANTVGAIIGVYFAIHIGMPVLGLAGLIIFGASIDIALGLTIVTRIAKNAHDHRRFAFLAAFCACAILTAVLYLPIDPYKMASGVYRNTGVLTKDNAKILYAHDGKTATVTLSLLNGVLLNIRTNGKVDAGITTRPDMEATPDEATMVLAAAIPMALHPEAKIVANIGFGSGLTTHTLLLNPRIRHVDSVEIEQCMVEAARGFGSRVLFAHTDPRSEIHISDAKTFFSSHREQFDMIISEPSNPWISGVSSLFSREYYHLVKQVLRYDGLFVQWFQLYEIDVDLVVSILKAIDSAFADYVVYATNDTNLLVVAKRDGRIGTPLPFLFGNEQLSAALNRISVTSPQDISIRKVADKRTLSPLLDTFPIAANSDYFPVLDQHAARTLFLKSDAKDFHVLENDALPTMEMLMGSPLAAGRTEITPTSFYTKSLTAATAMALRDYFTQGRFPPRDDHITPQCRQEALQVRRIFRGEAPELGPEERFDSLFHTAIRMVPSLSPGELESVWRALEAGRGTNGLSPRERRWLDLFKAAGRRDAKEMIRASQELLSGDLIPHRGALQYAVVAGMVGHLTRMDREAALALWQQYQAPLCRDNEPNLLLRLLAAYSEGR